MKIFAANWKLNKTPRQARDFFSELKISYQPVADKKLVVFPSAFALEATANALDTSDVEFGAQNCYCEKNGAFTGENSAEAVKELGGQWVLIGHSERRALFGETDELLAKKVKLVQSLDLYPMLCIGETLAQREAGETDSVLKQQLQKGLALADSKKFLAVAYEPVWAIGTGKVAMPDQVRAAHLTIFQALQTMGYSAQIPILYGGSVKADNAGELIKIPHVHGFLIGGASLDVKSYLSIFNA